MFDGFKSHRAALRPPGLIWPALLARCASCAALQPRASAQAAVDQLNPIHHHHQEDNVMIMF